MLVGFARKVIRTATLPVSTAVGEFITWLAQTFQFRSAKRGSTLLPNRRPKGSSPSCEIKAR
jgi:hypothetical protein